MEWEGEAWDAITLDEKQYETLVEKKWDVFCFGTLAQRSKKIGKH